MTKINHLQQERIFFLYPFLLSALLLAAGCQKQPVLNFGPNFVVDNSDANIVVVDTCTVVVSTVYNDSTATAGTGFSLVGNYTDKYLGNISTRSFLQVAPPAGLPQITNFDTYDSIGLILIFKKGNPFYGDTTIPQTFMINQVTSLYQLGSFQHGFYSNSSFPISSTDWGTATATIAPTIPYTSQDASDTLQIKMPDSLGMALYNLIYNNSDDINKPTNWLNFFHGLCISPAPGSQGAIYGFNDSAVMRIYYHEAAAFTTLKYIDFILTNKSFQFNNITYNPSSRLGSPIQRLDTPTIYGQTPPGTQSDSIGYAGYLDGPLGLQTKLTFPNLNGIATRPDYIGLLRAQLTVTPVPGSYSTTWRLPPAVGIYTANQYNLQGAQIPSTTSSALQTGNLVVDYLNPLNTVYSYDVTPFIAGQITNTTTTASQDGVLLSIASPANVTSFNRAVLSDFTYPVQSRVTLSVYYISLYPHQ